MKAPLYNAEELAEARDWFRATLRSLIRHEITHLSMSEWAERKRILPQGLTSMPGPFRWETTPYLREIADCLSATSPVQKVAVMKGAQLGFSVGVLENWIGYTIDVEPGPMLYVSGDKGMAEAAVEVRIDRMIESAGLSGRIFAPVEKKHGKATGDTKGRKDFPGGFLMAIGPNVGAKLRQFSVQKIAFDEVDAYPQETGEEGDPLALAERRTDAFEAVRKILYISTPLVDQTSKIKPLFEAGDQRKFFVPCRSCGEYQELEWSRMKFARDETGRLIWDSVRYECASCGAHWRNEDKAFFLPRGEWRPTATPREPGFRSYHLSALYSPVGMRSWESIAQEWVEGHDDLPKLRAFVNTVLGEPFVERGEAPRWERIMLRREGWWPESIRIEDNRIVEYGEARRPDGALIVTIGADVQKDRIECEIVAWGQGKESWSIGYHVLPGETADLNSPAWSMLGEIIAMQHAGLPTALVLIDAGYNTPTVYQFVERYETGVAACMGDTRVGRQNRVFVVKDVEGYLARRVDLYTDQLKLEVYAGLGKAMPDSGLAPPGYCHFPEEYGEKYFRQLTAEERVPEKTRTGQRRYVWKIPDGRRNEALDCRVYALGALYVYASEISAQVREDGLVDWVAFWDWLSGSA